MGAGGRQLEEFPVRVSPKRPTGSPTPMVEQAAPDNQAKLMWLKDVTDAITLPEHALDPSNRYAWQRFDQSKFVRKEHFEETLAAAPGDYLKLQAKLEEDGPPTSEAERDRFAVRLKILVRLQALGVMAAHRAVMEGRESATLSSLKGTGKGGANKRSETVAMVLLAADRIRELNEIKASLVDSRSRLRRISSRAIQESRLGVEETETYLTEISEQITAFQDDDARGRFNYSVQRFAKPDADKRIWPAALRTLADNLVDWRQGQINIVAHMLYSLHEAFPFFAKADTEDILQSISEEEVVARTRAGFTQLLEAIDIATIEIGSGDIDAFDLPEALKLTIHDLSPALQNAAHRVIAHHRTVQFWKTMGLTGLQLAIAFVPVVGPFVAAGIGAAQFGADLESMLDKSALAAGSNQPGRGMLGVEGPSSGEWAMMIAVAAMTIADLRAGVKVAKGPSAPRPMHELDYELAEPRGLFEERAPVGEQGTLESRVEPSKFARTRTEAPTKQNMRARTRETGGSERRGPKWDTGERTPPGAGGQRAKATGTGDTAADVRSAAVRPSDREVAEVINLPKENVAVASIGGKGGVKDLPSIPSPTREVVPGLPAKEGSSPNLSPRRLTPGEKSALGKPLSPEGVAPVSEISPEVTPRDLPLVPGEFSRLDLRSPGKKTIGPAQKISDPRARSEFDTSGPLLGASEEYLEVPPMSEGKVPQFDTSRPMLADPAQPVDLGLMPAGPRLKPPKSKKELAKFGKPFKRIFGEPSEFRSGTNRRIGMSFNERNAAETMYGLETDYNITAGRPNRVTYRVVAGTRDRVVQTDRAFTRQEATEGAQATTDDYTNTGWDRGHLAQREAFKGNVDAELAADQMPNIVPMHPNLNRGEGSLWRAAEVETVRLADKYGTVTVEVTPVYEANPPRLPNGTPIPKEIHRKVIAPDGKILLDISYSNN